MFLPKRIILISEDQPHHNYWVNLGGILSRLKLAGNRIKRVKKAKGLYYVNPDNAEIFLHKPWRPKGFSI